VYEALFAATARYVGVIISTVDVSFALWDAEELRTLLSDAGLQRIAMTPRSLMMHLPALVIHSTSIDGQLFRSLASVTVTYS
jgi:hypothetical protein